MADMKCAFCGKPAELYCDFMLGARRYKEGSRCSYETAVKVDRLDEWLANNQTLPCFDTMDNPAVFTCDAPICEACTEYRGLTFFDGDASQTRIERNDFCPFHAGQSDLDARPITDEEADRMREKIWRHRDRLKLAKQK